MVVYPGVQGIAHVGSLTYGSKVLLLIWQSNLLVPEPGHGTVDFLEMFSGEAEVTKYWCPSLINLCYMRIGVCEHTSQTHM